MTADFKYIMSFTVGGLLQSESVFLAKMYFEKGSWQQVRELVQIENPMQIRTLSARERISSEVIFRLMELSSDELDYFGGANLQEQRYLLWLAVCRRYRFIAEFSMEVLHERFVMINKIISFDDYDFFFDRKAEWNPRFNKLKSSSRAKLRSVLFRIMKEAEIIDNDNHINTMVFSPNLYTLLTQTAPENIQIYPGLIC